MFRTIWSRYQTRLQTHPYTTNALTTGVVIGLGDACAQYIEQHKTNTNTLTQYQYNKVRGSIMFSWGLLAFGPFFTHWYRLYTPGRIGARYSTPTVYNIVMKCLFTSIIAIPINATFFVYATSIEHYTAQFSKHMTHITDTQVLRQAGSTTYNKYNNDLLLNELQERFQNRFFHVVQVSWLWWFPFNFVNWYYIPLNMRMVFSSFAAVGWNCFLSLVQHRQPAHYNVEHTALKTKNLHSVDNVHRDNNSTNRRLE